MDHPSLDMKFFDSSSSKEKFRRIQALEEQVRDLQSKLEAEHEDMVVKTRDLLLGETGIKNDIRKLHADDEENMRVLAEEMGRKTRTLEGVATMDRRNFRHLLELQDRRIVKIYDHIDQGRHAMNQVQRDVKKLFKLIEQTRRPDHEEPSRFYTFPDDDENWDLPVAIRPAKTSTDRARAKPPSIKTAHASQTQEKCHAKS